MSSGDQKGSFFTARALGMALGALHDGYVLAKGSGIKLLSLGLKAPARLDAQITAAAACHQLLLHRYPQQSPSLNAAWDFWFALFHVPSPPLEDSELFGRRVGDAVHLFGIRDRQIGTAMDPSPDLCYRHRPPPNEPKQPSAGTLWGTAKPLVATRVSGFAPPPGRTGPLSVKPNAHFAADFLKVQSKGAAERRGRSLEEEVIGISWGYDDTPEIGSPPRLYMQVVLSVLDTIKARNPGALSAEEELLLLTSTALAMADAGIEAWHYKYSDLHMMWRPVLGIPHGLGALVPGEPGWLPLGQVDTNGQGLNLTPNFPSYPSAHATFGAAALQLLRLYLHSKGLARFDPRGKDDVAFSFFSDEFNGCHRDPRTDIPRSKLPITFTSLWDAITANAMSRVYLGLHWQFDGVTIKGRDPDGEFGIPISPSELGRRGGVWLGCQIAHQLAAKIGIRSDVTAASMV
ncbi:MAG: vanadium-dependent haloperoxidase [Cyanobium sp.]